MDNLPVYTQSNFYSNPFNVCVSDWVFIEPVDLIIEELVVSKNFLTYINSTNKKIIKNPSRFKDLSKKTE